MTLSENTLTRALHHGARLMAAITLAGLALSSVPARAAVDSIGDRRAAAAERLRQLDRADLEARRVELRSQVSEDATRTELRAAAEEKRIAAQARYADGSAMRTQRLTELSEVDSATVWRRLNEAETAMLEALAEVDSTIAAAKVNAAGTTLSERLEGADGSVIGEERMDALVAAAARAETITPEEVDRLLAASGDVLSSCFDSADANVIAAQLNAVGEKALDARSPIRSPE